jgi:carboxypeptidase family protein/Big-like domain-containing protein
MRPRLFVMMLLAAGFIGCGDDNNNSGPPSPSPVPVFLGPPKSLQIAGTLTFGFVGESRQLTASATFRNGAVRDVTRLAQWASSDPAVATVAAGLVKVVALGQAQITATYRDLTSPAATVSATAPAILTSISISGPQQMAPGTTAQFTLNGTYSDGSKDVSASASWNTFPTNILRSAGGGRVEALAAGDAQLFVNFDRRFTSTGVLVIPPGTFKVSGRVTDSSGAIENVEVRVVSGTGAGLAAKTDFGGNYALYGVAGDVRLSASAPGYVAQEIGATITSHTSRNFALTTSSTSVDVSGQWTMTFRTSSACSSDWSPELRQRQVAAAITQQGTRLAIRVLGPAVFTNFGFGTAQGRIAGTAFSMTLLFDDYYLIYSLMERINPTEWVAIRGSFEGTTNSSVTEIEGTFTGSFDYYVTAANATFPSGPVRTCAADPQVQLRR